MGRIREMLSARLAGIPAWVWGLVIGGAIVTYAWITQRKSSGPQVAPVAPVAEVDQGSAGSAADIEGIPTVTAQETPVTTNPAWVRLVADRMVADAYDPVLVNNALTKALAGLEMTEQEAALYSLAVRKYGQPPEGAPPIKVVKGGGTTAPPAGNTTPSLLSVTDVNYDNSPWKRITWSAVTGATGYQLRFSGNEGSVFTVKDAIADWRFGKTGGKLTVTPVMADGSLGTPTVLTI